MNDLKNYGKFYRRLKNKSNGVLSPSEKLSIFHTTYIFVSKGGSFSFSKVNNYDKKISLFEGSIKE